jgi:hypothetical protein
MSVTSVTMTTLLFTISATPLHGVAISVPSRALHHFFEHKIRCDGMAENFQIGNSKRPIDGGAVAYIVYIVFTFLTTNPCCILQKNLRGAAIAIKTNTQKE